MKINIPKAVLKDVENQSLAFARLEIEDLIRGQFEQIKEDLLFEFMSHPVTEEILARENAENISGTLDGKSGNLFSFIGFDQEDDPISPIIDLLNEISLSIVVFKKVGAKAVIKMPTAQDIFDITPMPWAEGRSWAKGIETGISGIGFYLHKFKKGRSGGGIQVEKNFSGGRFKNTKYISHLINKYTKKFSLIDGGRIKIRQL